MKSVLALAGAAVLTAAAAPALANSGQAKVDLCHSEGTGSYHLISIAEAAYAKHLEHGDAKVGEAVPGTDGAKIFDETCQVVDAPPTGPVVTPGYSGLTEAAGVRYRGQNTGNEIYLGIPDLGVGTNRVETGYTWSAATYKVTFAFDADANAVNTSIVDPAGATQSLSYDFDDKLAPKCDVASWNTMDILVADRQDPFNLRFTNVALDGNSLGDFGDEGWNNWTVTGFDFTKSFELTGDLVVDGTWTGSETSKLQISVGCKA